MRPRMEASMKPPSDQQKRMGAILAKLAGRWIAQDGDEILFVGDSPEEVIKWLRGAGKVATVWRVPASEFEANASGMAGMDREEND